MKAIVAFFLLMGQLMTHPAISVEIQNTSDQPEYSSARVTLTETKGNNVKIREGKFESIGYITDGLVQFAEFKRVNPNKVYILKIYPQDKKNETLVYEIQGKSRNFSLVDMGCESNHYGGPPGLLYLVGKKEIKKWVKPIGHPEMDSCK